MTFYAILNNNNIVESVFEGAEEIDGVPGEQYYTNLSKRNYKKTCIDTYGNVNIKGGVPFRKNFARVGMIYDEELDGFIYPKKFEGWIFDSEKGTWKAPFPVPEELMGKGIIEWDNNSMSWYVVERETN